jgi:hypothetical protein
VDQAGGAGFGGGWASIVDGGGAGAGVAHELLDGGQVGAGVEEFAGESSAAVVRAELRDAGRGGAALHDPVLGRRAEPAAGWVDPAALVDREQQRPGLVAAYGSPVLDRGAYAGTAVAEPDPVALAVDLQLAAGPAVVVQVERGAFGPAKAGAEQDRQRGGVTGSGGARVGRARGEQGPEFAGVDVAAGVGAGQGGAVDRSLVDGAVVVVALHQFQPPALL